MNKVKKRQVLILTTIAGFLPQFEMNNVKLLQNLGYKVHYASNFKNPVYTVKPNELKKQGIVLHQIDIHKSPLHIIDNLKAFIQIRKIIHEEEIDVIHCHNPMGGVVGRLAAHFSKKKPYTIYTAHGFHFYKGAPIINWLIYYTVERLLGRITNQLITINHEDYNAACKFKLAKEAHVDIIPGVGLNRNRYYKDESLRESMRKELNIPETAFHMVSVGELVSNKNHEAIIKALIKMRDPDIYYSICGKGPNLENLENMVYQYKLQKRVRLLGYRTDVERVLQSADCFVFPSIREGFGMASIEALACEVPLIVADNRGTREYTMDRVNGLVCDAMSVEDFMHAIAYMKINPEARIRMGKKGGEVAKKFYVSETEKKMMQIYKRMTEYLF